jgi:hypothetical protein
MYGYVLFSITTVAFDDHSFIYAISCGNGLNWGNDSIAKEAFSTANAGQKECPRKFIVQCKQRGNSQMEN